MPIERTMVCTRPDFDPATIYAAYWVGRTLRKLEEFGLRITDLLGEFATKEKLVEALENYDPIAYWGVGHGNATQFAGQDAFIMLEKEVDESLFIGRIVHLTSCLTGLSGGLLESIAGEGAIAAFGYSVELIVGVETGNFPNIPSNKATESLLAPDCAVETMLSLGKTIAEAVMESDNLSNVEIENWRKSGHPDADLLIWAHINNRDGKVLYGLPEADEEIPAPIHPLTALASVASITGLGLVVMKW